MLSSSRRCLSINKQRYTPRGGPLTEPLLCLYPRWFRTAAASYQQPDTTPTAIAQRAWTNLGQLPTSGHPIVTATRTKLPRRVWTDVSRVESTDTPRSDKGRIRNDYVSRYEATLIPQGSQANSDARKDQLAPSTEVSRSWNNVIASCRETETGATSPSPTPLNPHLGSTAQTLDERDYDPKLRIRRTGQSAYRQVLAKGPEYTPKTIKKEATKKLHDPASIEWSEPIRLLAQLIYRPKKVLGERLELHRDTIYDLTGTLEANAWFHPVRLGCEIRVLDERARHRDKLVVILHGMSRARQLTREYLLWVEREVAKSAHWSLSSEQRPVLSRFVLSSLAWHCRTKSVRRADTIEQPLSWTVRSFANVVETLTSMQIPRQLRRELYEDADSHNRTVANVLETLFSDPRSESCISLRALNKALQFTCAHTELEATSSFLFEKAKSIGLSIQADTYNILIEQSLRQNKLDYYRSLLASMQRMGVVPNEMTWVTLLRVTKSRSARRAILQRLRYKWPKKNKMWQQVAIELVTTDFARLVRLEKSFDDFVDFMDQSLPSDWLSARCINRMLNVCAEKKLWDVVPRVVELGERRGGFFNTGTHSALLKVFQKRGSVRDSISLLESHFAKTVGRDSAFAIPMVFMTAWNSRFYNVCRVLWRYAAVSGNIAYNMQNVVATSLVKNNDESNKSASHLWRITAGKVIVGTDLDVSGLASQCRFLNQDGLKNPMKVLAQWTPDDGPRQEQLSLAYTIMQRDLTAYKHFWPLRSQQLFDLLKKAYEVDCEWMHKKKVRQYSDLSWMIEEAVEVPLRPLPNPSISPQHLLWPTGNDISK
jgi:pentatricopeptide repeat protein